MTLDGRPLLAGNWKMNGLRDNLSEMKKIADGIDPADSEKVEALLCPPLTLLYVATALCDESPLAIGAQDCHFERQGPHTGDVSAEMIADCFATYVIVGHSERRHDHGESSELVCRKATAAHEADLTAIICIGETGQEYEEGRTLEVLRHQLRLSVPEESRAANTVIAYEPVWAIGSGRTPEPHHICELHAFLRKELVERFGENGQKMRILYGGSANPSNAATFIRIENVNGLLVGGASLESDDFLSMHRTCVAFAEEEKA